MKGRIAIPVTKWQRFVVAGGPYRDKPAGYTGVKMAAEIHAPHAVSIPTQDFSTPDPVVMNRGLREAIELMNEGKPLYAGCAGGIGRTGLFLAVLAKAFGVNDPIKYVRAHYYAHAVETSAQMKYVEQFPFEPATKKLVANVKRHAWRRFWRTELTDLPEKTYATKADIARLQEQIDALKESSVKSVFYNR